MGRQSGPKDQRVGSNMVAGAAAGLFRDHRRDESGTCFEQCRCSQLGSYSGRV
jgi:hypothetical protein